MTDEIIYKPSRWGEIYHGLTTDEALGGGAAGLGKSLILLHEADRQIWTEHDRCANPEHQHPLKWGCSQGWALHLRRTRPMLEQTIARAHQAFPAMDPKVRWDSTHSTFHFASGYRYTFGHCKDRDDYESYRSNQYSILQAAIATPLATAKTLTIGKPTARTNILF